MKAPAFEYHRPTTLEAVTALLATLDDCRLLAGGQSLMPMLNFRVVAPAHLVDLNQVRELAGIEDRGGERWLPFRSFCDGYMTHALAADEVLCEIRFPVWQPGHGWSFMEFARRKGDFAMVSIAALAELDSGGRVQRCAIALGGIGAAPVRVADAEALLAGRVLDASAIAQVSALCAALPAGSDPAVPAWYRQQLAGVLAGRALQQVARRAREGRATEPAV